MVRGLPGDVDWQRDAEVTLVDAVNKAIRSFYEHDYEWPGYTLDDIVRRDLIPGQWVLMLTFNDECTVQVTGFFDEDDLQAMVLLTDVYHCYYSYVEDACQAYDMSSGERKAIQTEGRELERR